MIRVSEILKALEQEGGSLDYHDHALVWIDRPEEGCYVRARDVISIQTYFRGTQEVWSKVRVAQPDNSVETLTDQRRPKSVRKAIERAEIAAADRLLSRITERLPEPSPLRTGGPQ